MTLLLSLAVTVIMVSPVFLLASGLPKARPVAIRSRFNATRNAGTRIFRG